MPFYYIAEIEGKDFVFGEGTTPENATTSGRYLANEAGASNGHVRKSKHGIPWWDVDLF